MSKFYAGIGSRTTPAPILLMMTDIARKLSQAGYILRSGGAIGADKAFEVGATVKQVFRPKHSTQEAEAIAETIHPAWFNCTPYVKQLHGRNMQIVLGQNLDSPVEFVVCWTPQPIVTGGTRMGVVAAQQRNIPVYNLVSENEQQQLNAFLEKIGAK